MARPLRVEYPGASYHVINCGNGGENIINTQSDKKRLLEYVGEAAERFAIIVHTYCLMRNHYHLLVEISQANLSVAIQWLNVSYAVYYNRKNRRSGHLFQGRFKALLIDADQYLLPLSRYIHLNPVRAKIVRDPVEYRWSSYGAFVGETSVPDFLKRGRVLACFGKKRREAIRSYRAFVEGVDTEALENPGEQAVGGFILGDGDFVNRIKQRFLSTRDEDKEIPQLKKLKPKVSPETIVKAVCDEVGCDEEHISEKGRKGNKARDLAIYLARQLSGGRAKDLGGFFGGISGAAITVRYNQVGREMTRDKTLRRRVSKIKERILNN